MFSDIATLSIACTTVFLPASGILITSVMNFGPNKEGRKEYSLSRLVCVPEVHGIVGLLWRYTVAKWNMQHTSLRESTSNCLRRFLFHFTKLEGFAALWLGSNFNWAIRYQMCIFWFFGFFFKFSSFTCITRPLGFPAVSKLWYIAYCLLEDKCIIWQ